MKALRQLTQDWLHRAHKQFECEERTQEDIGKRVMSHGAMVYVNCAAELQEALGHIEPMMINQQCRLLVHVPDNVRKDDRREIQEATAAWAGLPPSRVAVVPQCVSINVIMDDENVRPASEHGQTSGGHEASSKGS